MGRGGIDYYKPRKLPGFSVVKPVIGVIHLKPLPGSPLYKGGLEDVIEYAVEEASKLIEGGVDGVIIENFMDTPFKPRVTEPETIAAFTRIVVEVRRTTDLPVGVNLLRNSGIEALAIACSTGADFIRVNALAEPVWAPEGLLQPIARELHGLKARLGCGVNVYADVNVKHSKPILDLVNAVKENSERGLCDALIISGSRTGSPVNPVDIAIARKYTGKPLLIGSGITPWNIGLYWRLSDGFIVGTYFKDGGVSTNPVNIDRVKKLVSIVEWFRKTYS